MQIKVILSKPTTAAFLIISGPLLTLAWVYSLRIPEAEIDRTTLTKTIIYLAVTAVVISFIAHSLLSFKKGLIWSAAISELICQTLFVYFALGGPNWAKNFMWLPIMMISVASLTLPIVLSASYGSGIIVNALRPRKREAK